MNKKSIIESTRKHIKTILSGEASGHDWWHIYRVYNLAKRIGTLEKADMFVVELAALLHDIADWKLHGGDETIGPKKAREWLEKQGVDEHIIQSICDIIVEISFKGAGVQIAPMTIEGQVVQDADRLDAMGAIGIARTFAYGGYKGRVIHNPIAEPVLHQKSEDYKASADTGTTINHFYEKLLILKDRVNTNTGKQLAQARHDVMVQFLEEFYKEWDGQA